jgi:hypothetical protein
VTARMIVALLLCAPLGSIAANWVKVAEGKDFSEYAVDVESIEVVSHEDGLVSAEHVIKNPHRFPRSSDFLRVMLHHCFANKAEIIEVWYFEKGRKLGERELPEYLYKPMDLRPGSVGEAVHKFVCVKGVRRGS